MVKKTSRIEWEEQQKCKYLCGYGYGDVFTTDSTTNAVYYDVINNKVYDPTENDISDAKNYIIRSCGGPDEKQTWVDTFEYLKI